MKKNYLFTHEMATKIANDDALLLEEATKMKEAFIRQGNTAHSLEMSHVYSKAMFLEKVFYEQLVPIYNTLTVKS